MLPWFAFILAVVAGVVLQLAAGYADPDTEQDEKRDRVRPNPGVSSYSEFLRIAIYAELGDRTCQSPCITRYDFAIDP